MLKYLQINKYIYASKIKCNNISNLSSNGLPKKKKKVCVLKERESKSESKKSIFDCKMGGHDTYFQGDGRVLEVILAPVKVDKITFS